MNRTKRLIKNTAILSIGTVCTKALTFVMIPFFSRWLSTSEYGEFDLLYTYVTLIIPLITLSCGEAVFRKLLDADEIREKKIISTSLLITLIGSSISTIFIIIVFHFYNPSLTTPFLILTLVETFNQLMMFYARGKKRLKQYTVAGIAYVIIMCFSVFLLVRICNMGLSGMFYGYSLGFLLSGLILMYDMHFLKKISFKNADMCSFKEIIAYSIPLVPNAISWWIANVSDRTIIAMTLGNSSNGIYAIANKIPAICTTMFSVFHLSWQENASESIKDDDREQYFSKIYSKIVKLVIVICICVLSINPFIFEYILDIKYMEAFWHVPILMTAVIFSFLAQFLGGIFIALEDTKHNGFTTVLAAIVNIILNICLINTVGLYAASISTFISYLILFMVRSIHMKKYIFIKLEKGIYFHVIIYLIFLILQYINNKIINIISFLCSIIYFFIFNKNDLIILFKKMKHSWTK